MYIYNLRIAILWIIHREKKKSENTNKTKRKQILIDIIANNYYSFAIYFFNLCVCVICMSVYVHMYMCA